MATLKERTETALEELKRFQVRLEGSDRSHYLDLFIQKEVVFLLEQLKAILIWEERFD